MENIDNFFMEKTPVNPWIPPPLTSYLGLLHMIKRIPNYEAIVTLSTGKLSQQQQQQSVEAAGLIADGGWQVAVYSTELS